jgi:raffinose/stachyose/melibiose transport system permease protein
MRSTKRTRMRTRGRPTLKGFIVWLLGTIWLVIVLAPLYYMVVASFRSPGDYFTADPWVPGTSSSLGAYRTVFSAGLGSYFLHSVMVTVATVVLTLAISLAFAFRVARRSSRLPGGMFRLVVLGLAVPIQAIIVPLYIVIVHLGLYDSLLGLTLALSATSIAVAVLLMVNFVRDIPTELFDAVTVDGGGHWTVFGRLVVPLSRGVLVGVGIYVGLSAWNNFLLPLIVTESTATAVLPLGLVKFQGLYGVNVPAIMAAVLLSAAPLLVLYLVARKRVLAGLSGISLR